MINSAGVCKTSVAEYYQSLGQMPIDAKTAGCSDVGSANTDPPVVVNGEIQIKALAGGTLSKQLTASGGGDLFAYKADCSGAACAGDPISAWSCSATGSPAASTSISPKFLPATCR